MKFSVVIPVYNSAPTLIELSSQLITFFTNRANEYEIIFTDDYSTDDSWNVLKKIALDNKNLEIDINGIGFMRICSNRLVNMKFVDKIDFKKHEIQLNTGECMTISRRKWHNIKDFYRGKTPNKLL